MTKMFRWIVTTLLLVVGLASTAGAFAQPYYRRPPYRRHFYHRPYRRPYYRHHRPYYRR